MRSTLNQAIKLILKHEGGYVNHPKDPGGETNYGITKATAQAHGYFGDMKSLPLELVTSIYRDTYWQRISGDDLPSGLDVHVFDMAVNAGPGTAVRLLQRLVGVAEDGDLGPVTLGAIASSAIVLLVQRYTQARLDYYKKLSGWPTFGRGWASRLDATTEVALELAKAPAPVPTQPSRRVLIVRVDGAEILRIIQTGNVSIEWEQV